MILMIFEVISIIVVAVRCKVLQDPTLVFWLGRYVCRGLAKPLHTWRPSLLKRYFLKQNIVIINEHDFDDNWKIQWMKKLFSCNYYLMMNKKIWEKNLKTKKDSVINDVHFI